jgi:EAL domain-containing protein (putative c-di-GMP-specific phosphodiesterase class I)
LGLDGAPALVFQPAVDLATGRLLGFEALLRWYDSSGGTIPPDTLIPWAEANGHMADLHAWVLSEACQQAARWPSDLQLAVNCSVFQLRRGEAAIAAASALERSGLRPDRLTVEVTETSVADDQAAADLHAMTRLGIQLTVDDIGAGSSILETRTDCVVNTIKIDGSLIDGLATPGGPNRAIVETMVKLSRSLGICTVAEAVETADQVAILREMGADVAQGYFFSGPLAAEEAYVLAAMNPLPHFDLSTPAAQRIKAGRLKQALHETHQSLVHLIEAVQKQNQILVGLLEDLPGLRTLEPSMMPAPADTVGGSDESAQAAGPHLPGPVHESPVFIDVR